MPIRCRGGNLSGYTNLTYKTTVTFDANGGTLNGVSTQPELFGYALEYAKNGDTLVWEADPAYVLPTAHKGGVIFSGFSTAVSGGDAVAKNTLVTDAPTYYAQYTTKKLVSIAITQNPTKTAYTAFENFDPAGMVVLATFDSDAAPVTDYEVKNGTNLQAGTTSLTVSYTMGDDTRTATVPITVAKLQVHKPTADSALYTYNGAEQAYAPNGVNDHMEVAQNKRTNAGSQTVTVVLSDKKNTEWVSGGTEDVTFLFTIAKASFPMNGVTFANKTVKEDGNAHKLQVANLPNGVTVTYTGTKGYTANGVSEAGIYAVTVKFSVADDDNYEIPAAKTATLTINRARLVIAESGNGKEIVVVESEDGFAPEILLESNANPQAVNRTSPMACSSRSMKSE